MRYLVIFLFMLPVMSFAQTKADYEHMMGKFVKFYNNGQPDSIVNMFPEQYREALQYMWNPKQLKLFIGDAGEIISCKYVRTDMVDTNKVGVFTTTFKTVGEKTTILTIENGIYFGTLNLMAGKGDIDNMPKH